MNRITPSKIEDLKENEIFVFGSNLKGRHGAGAAKCAKVKFSAVEGDGFGPTGQCYAIPTKNFNMDIMSLGDIGEFVKVFIQEAKDDPEHVYLVTEVGCGLAKYEPKDIAPLFKNAKDVANIYLPQRFWDVINALES